MDPKVLRVKTAQDCETFAKNVQAAHPGLALEARRRAVELRAVAYGANTEAERDALAAVYAYEEVLSRKNGRTTRASRTWQMIKRHGVIEAVERAVSRREETLGYTALLEVGMQDFAFESVVLRHPHCFTAATLAIAQSKVDEWEKT